jgi:hypothetical protein
LFLSRRTDDFSKEISVVKRASQFYATVVVHCYLKRL